MTLHEPTFHSIKPNYRKKCLEVALKKGLKKLKYFLPFSVFEGANISNNNRFSELEIDCELGADAVNFKLANGTRGDFSVDFVLYHCEPEYEWSPINQIKMVLKNKMQSSELSVRVVADALKTSPSQVLRLLKKNHMSKQWLQLEQLARLAGYQLKVGLKPVNLAKRENDKLTWEDTFKEMAKEDEDWSDFDVLDSEGIEQEV